MQREVGLAKACGSDLPGESPAFLKERLIQMGTFGAALSLVPMRREIEPH
jgi:hypothetical protein